MRVPDRQVRARVRAPRLRVGRRPPRRRRAGAQAAQALGYDAEPARDRDLPMGLVPPRRGAGPDEQARRRRSSALDELIDEVGTDARAVPPADVQQRRDDEVRHRGGEAADAREPRLLRPVRARAHRVDPAQGDRTRDRDPADRTRPTWTGSSTRRSSTCCAPSPTPLPRSRPPPSCGRRTGSPTQRRISRRASTASTRSVGPVRRRRADPGASVAVPRHQADDREPARAPRRVRARVDGAHRCDVRSAPSPGRHTEANSQRGEHERAGPAGRDAGLRHRRRRGHPAARTPSRRHRAPRGMPARGAQGGRPRRVEAPGRRAPAVGVRRGPDGRGRRS